jgi:hypothetical protein
MTRLRWRRAGWCAVAALVLAVIAPPLHGCGWCFSFSGNPLALPHPKAIEIAVATRAAIDQGALRDKRWISDDVIGGHGLIALDRVPAPMLVKTWAEKQTEDGKARRPLSVHFVFIDTGETCGLIARGGAILFEPQASTQSDARVVTTRTVFYGLIKGEIGMGWAERQGLCCIEGDAAARALLPGGLAPH